MDRPEPGLVKWSSNSSVDSFVHINLQHRTVQLYEPTGYANKRRFDYERISRHDDFPPLTTYDWSPQNSGLLAVGTSTGVVNLLRIDDGSNAYIELGLKITRTCQAVAFNTEGLLAVGLDRVRMDQSLHIWDVRRLSTMDHKLKGFARDLTGLSEPTSKLEPSSAVSSIKFYEDSPNTLVAGIKAQGVRIHDLRDPSSVITFSTKCNNNIAIDYADQNYFASSALDVPVVMVWDRRATSRPVSSASYLQAVDDEEIPWGGALRLDQAIETDSDPSLAEGKHSLIRSLRYCRDRRGLLAVLSRTGQLRVLETNKEKLSAESAPQEGPELLHVHRSHELDVSYRETSRRNDRIVSFDWVTLASPALRPRALVLRANGSFDILEEPSCASDHIFKLVPWQAPHRGLQEGTPYHNLMKFESPQATEILAPLLIEEGLSNVPIFGDDKRDLRQTLAESLQTDTPTSGIIEHIGGYTKALPAEFHKAKATSSQLRAIRGYVRDATAESRDDVNSDVPTDMKALTAQTSDISLASDVSASCRDMHEALLRSLTTPGLPQEAQNIIDHSMLLRAKEKYLFDASINREVVSDDPWVRFAWDWVAGAKLAADDGGMVVSNMDLSYLGAFCIWTNSLGRDASTRLPAGVSKPDASQWERALGTYCKKRRLPKYDGVPTKWPHHRQICLEMCRWGDAQRHDPGGIDRDEVPEYPSAIHTLEASRALFRGDTKQAIEILKKASSSHPELLFVSLALQLIGRGGKQAAREKLDLDTAAASKTDPYLQAISSLIATGDWASIANQRSLPLADRAYVAVRNFDDDQLTTWLNEQVAMAVKEGDIEGIVLTGITEQLVDIFARYIQKFHDVQTAILILSICYPRYIDDIRCRAWRTAYRAHLQRHKLFFQRTKFDVESTKLSKRDGVPTVQPPSRQISLRCVYCDAETSLAKHHSGSAGAAAAGTLAAAAPLPSAPNAMETRNPLMATSISAGISCPNCGRHLPRCVVCLEVVGVPRSDRPEEKEETKMAGRFPTFCLKCEHVLHLDHARQWFARHAECPVPECRCRCNFRANPELNYR